jgi:hypothetical protein
MDLASANEIYSQITKSSLTPIVRKLIQTGIRYARIRVDWYLLPVDERIELESERKIAHDSFISSCDILARNMGKIGEDNSWRELLGTERKAIGDFACFIHMIVGMRAR